MERRRKNDSEGADFSDHRCSKELCEQKFRDVEDCKNEMKKRPTWFYYMILASLAFGSYTYTYLSAQSFKADHDQLTANTQTIHYLIEVVSELKALEKTHELRDAQIEKKLDDTKNAIINHDKGTRQFFREGKLYSYRELPVHYNENGIFIGDTIYAKRNK